MTKQKRGAAVAPKVLEAQHRNETIQRLKTFIAAQASKELAALITPKEYLLMYMCKGGGITFQPDKEVAFTKEELKELKSFFVTILKEMGMPIFPNKPWISLYDALTLGLPLVAHLARNYDAPTELTPLFKEAFGDETQLQEIISQLEKEIYSITFVLGVMESSIENGLILIHPIKMQNHPILSLFSIEVVRLKTEKRLFCIQGRHREAYRLAWFHDTEPAKLLSYLDIDTNALLQEITEPPKKLKVYIQKHAIQRMKERLDSIPPYFILGALPLIINKPKVVKLTSNKLLLEMWFDQVKLGYFVATIEDDTLLLRTFLFITSNGTPEGRAINKKTGLQILDKKYLALDKLSSFVAQEVMENDEIRTIFEEAGCGGLFDTKLQEYSERAFISKHSPALKLPQYLMHSSNSMLLEAGV